MGENELTHLVGGGVLVILVLDRVANLLKLFLNKDAASAPTLCQTQQHVESLAKATAAGFAEQHEDNTAIRAHLHNIANTLGSLVTGMAILQDRSHRDPISGKPS